MGSHGHPLGRTPEHPLFSGSPLLGLSHKEGAEIGNRPVALVRAARFVARGTGGGAGAETFFFFVICFFAVCGFLFGFLWARLYLRRWFQRCRQRLGKKVLSF